MYRAEIRGDKESLETLHETFKNYIVVDDGNYFLTCQKLQNINYDELFPFAESILNHMLSILKLKVNKSFNVTLGAIENVKKDNNKDIIIRANSIEATSEVLPATAIVKDKDGNIISNVSENFEPYVKCISNNNQIRKALDIFNEDHDWNNLFNVYEVIRKDMGGDKTQIVSNGWATGTEIDIFTCTAHNIGGGGKRPRHAAQKISPHCQKVLSANNPMELSTAKVLIKRILINWIDYRCL